MKKVLVRRVMNNKKLSRVGRSSLMIILDQKTLLRDGLAEGDIIDEVILKYEKKAEIKDN